MFGSNPHDTIARIHRDYGKLIERGEAKIARLRWLHRGASDFVQLELDEQIERCEAIVESMRDGLAMVQHYYQTWGPELAPELGGSRMLRNANGASSPRDSDAA